MIIKQIKKNKTKIVNNNKKNEENLNNPPHKKNKKFRNNINNINTMKTNEEEKIGKNTSKLELKNKEKEKNNNLSELNNNNNYIINNNITEFISKNNYNKNNNDFSRKLNDYELNTLNYQEAIKIDKRTYIELYFSLLRRRQVIIFTFYTYNDYNLKIIKISLFIFSFASYYSVNALFFTDSTMHKILEDQGDFNFIYQLPQILYSSLICSTII